MKISSAIRRSPLLSSLVSATALRDLNREENSNHFRETSSTLIPFAIKISPWAALLAESRREVDNKSGINKMRMYSISDFGSEVHAGTRISNITQ